MRMLGDASTAEDVTQAVFVKVWSSPELFRTGNFGAWIARVTRNRALDVIRSRTVRAETDLPQALPESESVEDTAFARIDRELGALGARLAAGRAAPADRDGLLRGRNASRDRSTNLHSPGHREDAHTIGATQAANTAGNDGDDVSDLQERGHEDWLDDVAVYALGAMPMQDAQRVRAHIATCEICRREYALLQPAVGALAESAEACTPGSGPVVASPERSRPGSCAPSGPNAPRRRRRTHRFAARSRRENAPFFGRSISSPPRAWRSR